MIYKNTLNSNIHLYENRFVGPFKTCVLSKDDLQKPLVKHLIQEGFLKAVTLNTKDIDEEESTKLNKEEQIVEDNVINAALGEVASELTTILNGPQQKPEVEKPTNIDEEISNLITLPEESSIDFIEPSSPPQVEESVKTSTSEPEKISTEKEVVTSKPVVKTASKPVPKKPVNTKTV